MTIFSPRFRLMAGGATVLLAALLVLLPVAVALAQTDVTNAAGAAANATETQHFINLLRLLRGLGVVLLLICLVVAAIVASWGRTGMAISVAVGAIVLFGGFWIFALIRQPLEGTADVTVAKVQATATFPQQVAPHVQTVLYNGLNLLTTAIAPFIIIYGMFLAISFAADRGDPAAVVSYLIGAVIAFAGSLTAQIYNVLPLTYTTQMPVNPSDFTAPKVYTGTQIAGGNGGLSGTMKNADGSVMTDANGNPILVPADPNFTPEIGPNGELNVRSTYYYSGETNSDADTDAGRSSTGVPLRYADANTVGVAAVDPNIIPYGSMITVQTPDGPRYYIAADTGGAVKSQTASGGSAPVVDFYSHGQVGGQYSNITVQPYTGTNFTQLTAAQKEAFFNTANFKKPPGP